MHVNRRTSVSSPLRSTTVFFELLLPERERLVYGLTLSHAQRKSRKKGRLGLSSLPFLRKNFVLLMEKDYG